ncbi:NAD-dependent epimerase/dehydratase family protein [Niabella terrae]
MEHQSREKRVLITGATGLLGANAAIFLYRQGYAISVLVRRDADLGVLEGLPCSYVYGDITRQEDVLVAVAGSDIVVHAAAVTRQWGIDRKTYEQVNIEGTRHVIHACLEHGVQRLIYISTANTLAPGTMEHPGTELGGFSLFSIGAPYIDTKYVAEQLVMEHIISRNLPAIIIHPTFMIGPYDSKPSSGALLQYGLHNKFVYCPPGGKNFVHVADVCHCIAEAIRHAPIGERYLVAGENLSYRDFFIKLADCSGRRPRLIRLPAFLLMLAGVAGSIIRRFRGNSCRLHYGTARLLCLQNYYNGNKAARTFGLKYRKTEQAITDALDWFKIHKFS